MVPAMSRSPLDRHLRIEPLAGALRARLLRQAQGDQREFTHILLMESGETRLDLDGSLRELAGPVGMILPPGTDWTITLAPGAEGWWLGVSPAMLGDALGGSAEAQMLAPLTRAPVIAEAPEPLPDCGPSALPAKIYAETVTDTPGSHLVTIACLRLILADLWRRSSPGPAAPGAGTDTRLLQEFRRLVELNYRSHLKVGDYAALLGVTYHRLHRTCWRNLQQTPLQLIHRRTMREAVMWLERSGLSIQQISNRLGFADASEFSHFFKRNSGIPPSRFRARARGASQGSQLSSTSFADWP